MRSIELMDAAFLYAEKRETPMHVGSIQLYTLPAGVNEQKFLAELSDLLRTPSEFRKPFGDYVSTGPIGALGPLHWEQDTRLDYDYHIRHSALPKPGRYRELFALVSRLHATLLDRNRPLWEIHLIEGLQNRQFALYMKMHHAAIDGMGSIQIYEGMCSTDKNERITCAPFSLEAQERYLRKAGVAPKSPIAPEERELRVIAEAFRDQFKIRKNLLGALKQLSGTWMGRPGDLSVPWHDVPSTSINTQISGARRFVAQSWSFDRIKSVSQALDSTINDTILAMCAGALRKYLIAHNELPNKPLKAMVPVSTRKSGDSESANAVSFITADLSTNIADVAKRLANIKTSTRAGKDLMNSLSSREAAIFAQFSHMPALLVTLLGLTDQFPAFSTIISNVPGPRDQLYWNGSRLDGIYPASIITHGSAMNITLVSYNKSMHFGIIACQRSIPQVQRMIEYLEESLQELENLAGILVVKVEQTTSTKRKTKVKKKSAK